MTREVAMRARWIVAGVLIAIGAVWIGQGLGLLRGSSLMVDDVRWAVVGIALVVAGSAVAWSAVRRRSPP
jgi:hypothetical protein